MARLRAIKIISLSVFIFLFLSSCAALQQSNIYDVHNLRLEGNIDEAIAKSEDLYNDDSKSKVMHALNLGLLYRMKEDYINSNRYLEEAKQESEYLRAISITENVQATLVNDTSLSYVGQRYEIYLLYMYKALNYIHLSDWDSSRVEMRQADEYARSFGDEAYDFAAYRYLSANIYEALGEYDSALIDYRKAVELYDKQVENSDNHVPNQYAYDYLRLLYQLRRISEYSRAQEKYKLDEAFADKHLLVIQNLGAAPLKQENRITVSISSGVVSIAIPSYSRQRYYYNPLNIESESSIAGNEEMIDVDSFAREALDEAMPEIIARTTARVAAKNAINDAAYDVAQSETNTMTSLLAITSQIYVLASEAADLRSWSLLPSSIVINKIALFDDDDLADLDISGKEVYNRVKTRGSVSIAEYSLP